MQIRSFPKPPRGDAPATPGLPTPDRAATGWDGTPLRRRRKDRFDKRRRETLFRTIAIGVLALIAMGAIAVVGLKRDLVTNDTVWRDPSAEPFVAPVQSMVPPSEEEALKLVREVLAMRTAGQFGSRVRLEGMTTEQAEDFLAHRGERDGSVGHMQWIGNMDANGIQIEAVQIFFEKDTTPARLALLTPHRNGNWQVDLASLANWNSVPWERFLGEPGSEADLRVVISRDNYFNGAYSSDQEWNAFRLMSPESDIPLTGYCRTNSAARKALSTLLRDADRSRVVLRVRKAAGPGNSQCEIVSVLAENWIVTGTPFEARFRDDPP